MDLTPQQEVVRPWGSFQVIKKSNSYWVKKLHVRGGARLSLQSHKYRTEIWFVLSGKIIVYLEGEFLKGEPGSVFHIKRNQKHRIVGETDAVILEIAFGRTSENDIARHEDDYGRAALSC